MATEMQKKQFIMGNIMESFLISKFNLSDSPTYDILAKMYDYANLNSNKELVRRLNKRRNLSTNIQSSVYEDAAYIVAERIVEDKTGVLKDLYVDLMQKKFPNVKALIDKINPTDDIVEARLKLKNPNERLPMLALISLKYDVDEMPSLDRFAQYNNYWEDLFTDDNGCMDERTLVLKDGTNIVKTGAFEKYKARRIKEICEYLGIEEKQFRSYFVEEMKITDSEMGTKLDSSNGSFEHLISARLIGNHLGGISWAGELYYHNRLGRSSKPYEPDIDEVIDAYYVGLFLKCRSDETKDCHRVAMMRDYKSDSPETDWLGLCATYQQDRIIKMMMNMQRKYYEDFSFKHTLSGDEKVRYDDIISTLQEKCEAKENYIRNLKNDLETIQMRERSASNKNYQEYEQKIKQLQKQLEEKEREITKIKRQSADKDEYIELLENDEDEILEVENEIDYEQLAKQKILFVGGLPETVNKVLSYFSFKKHIGKEYAGNIDVSVVSDVVIFYDFINHGLYYKVINVARDHKLNVIYCHGRNADRIISHIANNLSEQK